MATKAQRVTARRILDHAIYAIRILAQGAKKHDLDIQDAIRLLQTLRADQWALDTITDNPAWWKPVS